MPFGIPSKTLKTIIPMVTEAIAPIIEQVDRMREETSPDLSQRAEVGTAVIELVAEKLGVSVRAAHEWWIRTSDEDSAYVRDQFPRGDAADGVHQTIRQIEENVRAVTVEYRRSGDRLWSRTVALYLATSDSKELRRIERTTTGLHREDLLDIVRETEIKQGPFEAMTLTIVPSDVPIQTR